MPTPTADYQFSILGLLLGAGTDYENGAAGPSGLAGVPKSKTADLALDNQDGSFGSPDFRDVRVILLHLEILQPTADYAMDRLQTLKEAWAPVSANVALHYQLPGLGHYFYNGRPRGLEEDLADLKSGRITVIAEFHALDPIAHAA